MALFGSSDLMNTAARSTLWPRDPGSHLLGLPSGAVQGCLLHIVRTLSGMLSGCLWGKECLSQEDF